MHTSLKNVGALVFIAAGVIFIATQLNTFLKNQEDEKAKTIIINAIALECKEVKKQNNMPMSFYSSSKTINSILGNGVKTLDENTYMRLISLCYGKQVKSEKI